MPDPNFVLTESLDVDHQMVGGKIRANGTLTGAGAPASIPPSQKAWIYVDTTTGEAYVWDVSGAGEWLPFAGTTAEPGEVGWSLDGNAGAASAKLGTTDANDLSIVTDGVERIVVAPDGAVKVGDDSGGSAWASVTPNVLPIPVPGQWMSTASIGTGTPGPSGPGGTLSFMSGDNTNTDVSVSTANISTVERRGASLADAVLAVNSVNGTGDDPTAGVHARAIGGLNTNSCSSHVDVNAWSSSSAVSIESAYLDSGRPFISRVNLGASETHNVVEVSAVDDVLDSKLSVQPAGVNHSPWHVGEGVNAADPDSLEVLVPIHLTPPGTSEDGDYIRRATFSFVVDPLVPELLLMAGAPFAVGTRRVASIPLTLDVASGNYLITAP